MVLFVNCCIRDNSRTLRLSKALLEAMGKDYTERSLLCESSMGLDKEKLELRDSLIKKGDLSHPMFHMAKEFKEADEIVVAAPFWDLMFPSRLRAYFEEITASGLTFRYSPEGRPMGLCKAKRLIYVTSSGGPIIMDFGFKYVEALAKNFYGIEDVRLIKAEGLDIIGADAEAILNKAIKGIKDAIK